MNIMTEISVWMDSFLKAVAESFNDRVLFVGLQGSYARGEATATSDIDVVVILDELSCKDIILYNEMLDRLSHRELICGFLAGKNELMNWEKSDLFQFYHDTLPIKGNLDELLPEINDEDISRAIKSGVCNIYHGCVHNMLYEKSDGILKDLYKSSSFVIQAICYSETGKYVRLLNDLRETVSENEQIIIDNFIHLKKGGEADFQKMSEALFEWSKHRIEKQN